MFGSVGVAADGFSGTGGRTGAAGFAGGDLSGVPGGLGWLSVDVDVTGFGWTVGRSGVEVGWVCLSGL